MGKELKKFWNISLIDEENADLLIYDEIAMKKSRSWWSDTEGTEVTPTAFRDDLAGITANNICVRINSGGGDVFAAESIATAIKDEREKGKKITCKIDGICASAAVQIAMACEKIMIPSSAYMMIHDPLTFLFGYYQAADLKKVKSTLNTIKAGIVNAYAEKTGIDKTKIENLMSAETWYTGDEAVKNGFADEILHENIETETVEDSDDEFFVNGVSYKFAAFANVPEALKNKAFNVKNISTINKKTEKEEGVKEMEFKNAAELKAAFPDFVNELTEGAKNEGAKAERARLQAIDGLSGTVDGEMLNRAKYETFENAETVAYNAMKDGKFVNSTVLDALKDDAKTANGVAGTANNGTVVVDEAEAEKKEAFEAIDKVAASIFGK